MQLAEAADTTQRNISYWESGQIEMSLIAAIKLAQVLQVEVEYLAGYSNDFGEISTSVSAAVRYSEEEKKLIEDYRVLNTASKKLVKQTVETLRATAAQSGKRESN